MGRQTLRIVVVLGILVTLVGGTGIFAVLTDRATAGSNSVETGAQPRAADIQIAAADAVAGQPVDCGGAVGGTGFQDDISTAQFSVSNVQPGYQATSWICVKNVGGAPVSLTMGTLDLADLDTGCTGDEAVAGDTTCGFGPTMQPQAGELSPLLSVSLKTLACATGTPLADDGTTSLDQLVNGNLVIADDAIPVAPGAIACVEIALAYSPSALDAQLAQSDTATWRFKFDAYAN